MLPLHRPPTASTAAPDSVGAADFNAHPVSRTLARLHYRLRLHKPRFILLLFVSLITLYFLVASFLPPEHSPEIYFNGPRPPRPHFGPPPPFGGPGFPGEFANDDIDRLFRPTRPRPHPPGPAIDWAKRAELVKQAFVHAYHGYEDHAIPLDELLPLSNGSVNNFNGWGVTMVDALDTMYLMGLHDEFDRGVKWVEQMTFAANNGTYAPFFETVIRYLGGLLSAYALSHDAVLLQRADQLGTALLPAFNTTSGFPAFSVHTVTGATRAGWSGSGTGWLAEIASCTLEYVYLAKLTGRKEYWEAVRGVRSRLEEADVSKRIGGLFPTVWNTGTGMPVNEQMSIGALADSAYEYFLKEYLLTNQTDGGALSLYLRSMAGILSHNLYLSPVRSMLYVTDVTGNIGQYPSRKFEHLSCFFPGLLALGVARLPAEVFEEPRLAALLRGVRGEEEELADMWMGERQRHAWAAMGLATSCATVYSDMPAGLGPDEVVFMSRWELEWNRREAEKKERVRLEQEKLEAEKARQREEEERAKEREKAVLPGGFGAAVDDIAKKREPSPPFQPPPAKNKDKDNGGNKAPRPHLRPSAPMRINQTEEDMKLRWGAILQAWRDGRYDAETEAYVLPIPKQNEEVDDLDSDGDQDREEEEEEETRLIDVAFDEDGVPLGPVPGLRDPPPDAPDKTPMRDYSSRNAGYYLRPETIESYFIMWRTTGDEIWRERGWAAFEALERECKTASGYAVIRNTYLSKGQLGNSMPSYFLAETLKYLYLLFSDESLLPLDKYVFNTEAHPFPIFEWTDWEKAKFGIP